MRLLLQVPGKYSIFNHLKLVKIFQFSFFDIMDSLLFDRINRMDRIKRI